MRAVRVERTGGRDALIVADMPEPVPTQGEVLVANEFAGVNYIDVYQREGQYPLSTPFTIGLEAAGTAVRLGPEVTGFRVGDRVAYHGTLGAYAERTIVPADRLVQLPKGVSTRDAAALMLQGLTAHYLATSTYPLKAGDTCLVHAAAGGVGLLLCQIAKLRGARVLGTVSTERKAELVRAAGADEVIRYTAQDFLVETKRLTDGRGVAVVYDSVGRTTFDKSLGCLAPRGLLVLFGQSSGPVPPIDPQLLNQKGSLYLTRPALGHYVGTRAELLGRTRDLFDWVGNGNLCIQIDREVALEDAVEAHRALEGRETIGKILLKI